MGKLKEISDNEVRKISEKYNVDITIINNLLSEWEEYFCSCEEMKKSHSSQELEDEAMSSYDWALLSLLYYENKSVIESEYPIIFEKAVFTPLLSNGRSMKLSRHFTNRIIITFLKDLKKKKQLLDKNLIEEILKQKDRLGKRPDSTIVERNELIKIAAHYLRWKKIKLYAPIICDLLSILDIAEMQQGTIRQIIKRL